jgi:Spy/CpxP family protein refolding chaperone
MFAKYRLVLPAATVMAALCVPATLVSAGTVSAPAVTPPTTAPAAKAHHPLEELFAGLGLTADQKTQLKAILKPYLQKLEAWHKANATELASLRAQIKTAVAAHDRATAKAAFEQLKALRETAPKFKDLIPQIKAILTPAQLQTLKTRLEELRENHPGLGRHTAPTTQPSQPSL